MGFHRRKKAFSNSSEASLCASQGLCPFCSFYQNCISLTNNCLASCPSSWDDPFSGLPWLPTQLSPLVTVTQWSTWWLVPKPVVKFSGNFANPMTWLSSSKLGIEGVFTVRSATNQSQLLNIYQNITVTYHCILFFSFCVVFFQNT